MRVCRKECNEEGREGGGGGGFRVGRARCDRGGGGGVDGREGGSHMTRGGGRREWTVMPVGERTWQ